MLLLMVIIGLERVELEEIEIEMLVFVNICLPHLEITRI
jgi:hypothetical protein